MSFDINPPVLLKRCVPVPTKLIAPLPVDVSVNVADAIVKLLKAFTVPVPELPDISIVPLDTENVPVELIVEPPEPTVISREAPVIVKVPVLFNVKLPDAATNRDILALENETFCATFRVTVPEAVPKNGKLLEPVGNPATEKFPFTFRV